MKQRWMIGLMMVLTVALFAPSGFADNYTRRSGSTDWSNLGRWYNNTEGQFATNYPTISDQILMNANRVLTVDTNAFANSIVMPNTKNTSSTIILTNSAAGYTLTANTLRVGINSATQTNSQGYVYQSAGTNAATTVHIYGSDGGGGTYSMMGGSLSGTTLNVGGVNSSTANGTALMSQTGGAVSETNVNVAGIGTQTYSMAGGTLTATSLKVDSADANATGTSTFNHSAGTVTAAVSIGAEGTYNLTGGELVTPKAADVSVAVGGLLDINGGTLSQNLNATNVIVELGTGGGTIRLQSGQLQITNGIAQSVVNLRANLEISGGALNIGGQPRCYNNIKVIGDAATIQTDRLGANRAAASFTFELGANGVSTVNSSSYQTFNGASLLVDGSNYSGGKASITLFKSGNLNSQFAESDITVTNFADGLTVTVEQDTGANEVILHIQDGSMIVDDFDTDSLPSYSGRLWEYEIDNGWYAASGVGGTNSAWAVTNGVMQNSATNTGGYPVATPAEGSLWQIVSHFAADESPNVQISFDYDVGSNDTLYVHLWGYVATTNGLDGNYFGNPQGGNGGLSSQSEKNAGLVAYSLKDGSPDPALGANAAQALVALTGSGTYSNSIKVADFGIAATTNTSAVLNAGDFAYYLIGFSKVDDGTAGTTRIDNLVLTSAGTPDGPTISLAIPAGGPITMSWPASYGGAFNVLTNDDLVGGTWGTNSAMVPFLDGSVYKATNSIGSEPQLFYRLESE